MGFYWVFQHLWTDDFFVRNQGGASWTGGAPHESQVSVDPDPGSDPSPEIVRKIVGSLAMQKWND
jgi:hypothetical protein